MTFSCFSLLLVAFQYSCRYCQTRRKHPASLLQLGHFPASPGPGISVMVRQRLQLDLRSGHVTIIDFDIAGVHY